MPVREEPHVPPVLALAARFLALRFRATAWRWNTQQRAAKYHSENPREKHITTPYMSTDTSAAGAS